MRLYWEVARRSFRRWSTYRAATWAGVFTNTVFGYLRAYILIAVAVSAGGAIGGWDQAQLVTFAFITQGLINVSGAFGDPELAERVRSGEVVVDLYRPVDLQAWWLATSLGRATFMTLARGLPPVLLGAVVFDLRLAASVPLLLAGVVSVALAALLGAALRFAINLSAFWLLDNRGLDQLVTMTLSFFSGLLIPVVLFPAWLESIARVLPFAGMIQFPAEVLLGVHDGRGIAVLLTWQAGWCLALVGVGRALLGAASRKVVLQGG